MKYIYTYPLAVFSFIALFCSSLPTAHAQSWLWGKNDIGSSFVDSWPAATDGAGNVYGAGVASGSVIKFGGIPIPVSTSSFQSFWVKYDPTGTVLWADGTISGSTYLFNITTDPSNNLIVFGSFTSAAMQIGSFTLTNTLTAGSAQFYLAKISPTGTVLWAVNDGNAYSGWFYTFSTFMMSTGSVTTDAAGNIYITSAFNKKTMTIGGTTLTNADPSGATYDVFVAKYSPAGVPLWATSIGGNKDDYAFGITVSSLGEVYVSGDFLSSSIVVGSSVITNPYTNPLAYIAKFSGTTGTPSWGQSGGGKNGSFGVGLAHDNSGNVYLTGGFADTTITLGATTIPRPYPPKSATQLALYLVQYSPANTVTWNKSIASPNQGVWGYSIALASCGQIWVSGNYNEAAVIDPGDTLALTKGSDPVFIAGYNLSGGVVGYSGLGGGGDDQNGIACDAAGNVFLCSDFYGGTSFVVGPDTLNVSGGSEVFYMAKYANSIKPPDTIYTHNDTSISCSKSTSITLTAPAGYSTYYWDNASGGSTRSITTAGTYYVYCVTCGADVLIDTFNVSISAPYTTYNRIDTNLCASVTSVTLSGPPGYAKYKWNTGSLTPSIVVATAGIYFVSATSGCDTVVDTFHYTVTPVDTTGTHVNNTVCASLNPLTLTAPGGYTSWLWNTGSTASSISVSILALGNFTYASYGTKGCSTFADTFNIVVDSVPLVSLGNDTMYCKGGYIKSVRPPGSSYIWSTGSAADSVYISATGTYWLTVSYPDGCNAADTINVTIHPFPVVDLGPDYVNCKGRNDTLQSSITYTAPTYLWNDASTTPSLVAMATGQYWLQVTDGGCQSADTTNVTILWDTLNFYNHDTAICRGAIVPVFTSGNSDQKYQWIPTAGIAASTSGSPVIIPDTSATYMLTTSMDKCPDMYDSFHVDVQPNPFVSIGDNRFVCQFDTLHINASVIPSWYTHYIYNWAPSAALDNSNTNAVVFTPGMDTWLKLMVTTPAGCAGSDTALITVHPGNFARPDTTFNICPRDSVQYRPSGAVGYQFHPGLYLNDSMSSAPWIKAITSQQYTVVATSSYGCRDTLQVSVNVHPAGVVYLGEDVTIYPGETYQISPKTNCDYFSWFPNVGLTNAYISNPVASPQVSTRYIVHASNEWGCKVEDSININVDPQTLLTLPNAFTPGSGINKDFTIIKRGEATLNYFRIFNRWGNKVFETTNIDQGWDGTYNGTPQPFDVYIYDVFAVSKTGQEFHKQGNVTLIR